MLQEPSRAQPPFSPETVLSDSGELEKRIASEHTPSLQQEAMLLRFPLTPTISFDQGRHRAGHRSPDRHPFS